mmetsp:Transcript_22387/g.65362  ORF Transcript_22387/g.65362 Transcript_22387/m.65362 type:complete len:371 (+) Transcript_22387:502-1614(+)
MGRRGAGAAAVGEPPGGVRRAGAAAAPRAVGCGRGRAARARRGLPSLRFQRCRLLVGACGRAVARASVWGGAAPHPPPRPRQPRRGFPPRVLDRRERRGRRRQRGVAGRGQGGGGGADGGRRGGRWRASLHRLWRGGVAVELGDAVHVRLRAWLVGGGVDRSRRAAALLRRRLSFRRAAAAEEGAARRSRRLRGRRRRTVARPQADRGPVRGNGAAAPACQPLPRRREPRGGGAAARRGARRVARGPDRAVECAAEAGRRGCRGEGRGAGAVRLRGGARRPPARRRARAAGEARPRPAWRRDCRGGARALRREGDARRAERAGGVRERVGKGAGGGGGLAAKAPARGPRVKAAGSLDVEAQRATVRCTAD